MISRRSFLAATSAGCLGIGLGMRNAGAQASPLNFLLITVDDMNYNSAGFLGCPVEGITPNIDRLAGESLSFKHAHVTAAICQPSRQSLMTGRYPHNNGALGFNPIDTGVPTLQEQLRAAGYRNGILGKVHHLAPMEKFCWDTVVEPDALGHGRVPDRYYEETRDYIGRSKAAGKPFFLMANSQDPHRPFAGSETEVKKWQKHYPVSRTFSPDEIRVPDFLPDLPEIRKELAQYYTSVHRCDETAGAVLRALEESGLEENTLVMFLSDNGMSFPFAKTNCYLNSTCTPWLVRWPGITQAGIKDEVHFINGVDYMTTILEAAGIEMPAGGDGHSFLPLLKGASQTDRAETFTVMNTTSAERTFPMRCIQDRRFGYIFNAWSDGETEFRNESMSGLTMDAMRKAGGSDPGIQRRVELYLKRTPEELFDLERDPDALENLASAPEHAELLQAMRGRLLAAMERTRDPLMADFEAKVMTSNSPIDLPPPPPSRSAPERTGSEPRGRVSI